jgi:hypothetical protein
MPLPASASHDAHSQTNLKKREEKRNPSTR